MWALAWFVGGLAVNGLFVWANWLAVQPNGSDSELWSVLLLVFPLLACVLAVPALLLCLLAPKLRRAAIYGLIAAGLWLVTGVASANLAGAVRMRGMHRLAARSMPLVRAIETYHKDKGHPPNKLEDLVPEYIREVPETGLAAYPLYRLVTGDQAAYYEGNPWVLVVDTPSGGINFDVMAYFPDQNYPEVGHSGWWERVGAWGYLHE